MGTKKFMLSIAVLILIVGLSGCKEQPDNSQAYIQQAEELRTELRQVELELAETQQTNAKLKDNIDELDEQLKEYQTKGSEKETLREKTRSV